MLLRLYTNLGSGNAFKVELMLQLLDVAYDSVTVSIPKGEHLSEEFRAVTPFHQVPVLEVLDDVNGLRDTLSDSQAILCYLAREYGGAEAERWLPNDPVGLAKVMRWLSFSANEIQNHVAYARATLLLKWPLDYDMLVGKAYESLALMNGHLENREWLAASHATVADIACYPYLVLAAEGGIDTRPYTHVLAWLARVEALPRFVEMPRIPGLPEATLVPPPVS